MANAPFERGIALSGLDFGQGIIGQLGTNYFVSAQSTWNYFAQKGFTTVRLPFLWERIQQNLYGALDPTFAGIIDGEIVKAKNAGIKVILDIHNYGRYHVIAPGGFTDSFPVYFDPLVQGGTPGGGILQLFSYQRAILGSTSNPVSPATGYHITTNAELVQDFGGQIYDSGWIEFFRTDDNNKYFFTMNAQTGNKHWELFKVVNGIQTLMDQGNFTFNYGDTHTIDIDVNQNTSGKVTVEIDGTQVTQQTTDVNLVHGHVSIFSVSVQINLSNFKLNVAGDTSTANTNSGTFILGSTQLPYAALNDVWTKIATRYKDEDTVLAYDLMNEPHDMTVPTTSSNYLTTSTVTNMFQQAINAIRGVDTDHYILAELDQWAGAQNFVNNYGSNPTPWLTDSANRLIYSFHYYFDNDHSGSYSQGFTSANNTNIPTDVTPIMEWAQNNNLMLHCGEYGVPNLSEWQICLTTFLTLCNTYNVWTNHWAAGDAYTATTEINPTGTAPNFVDALQMAIVGASQFLVPYLLFNNITGTTQVTLLWIDDEANETSYLVYRQDNGQGVFNLLTTLPVNSITYVDNTVVQGSSYIYQVQAINSTTNYPVKTSAIITIPGSPPTPPPFIPNPNPPPVFIPNPVLNPPIPPVIQPNVVTLESLPFTVDGV